MLPQKRGRPKLFYNGTSKLQNAEDRRPGRIREAGALEGKDGRVRAIPSGGWEREGGFKFLLDTFRQFLGGEEEDVALSWVSIVPGGFP